MAFYSQFLTVHILTDSHILHLGSDDSSFGICHLGDSFPFFCTIRQGDMFKTQVVETLVIPSHASVFGCNFGKLLHITATYNPFFTHSWQTFFKVDTHIRVAERAAGIIYIYFGIRCRNLFFTFKTDAGHLLHFPHGYTDIRIKFAGQIYFLGAGKFYSLFHNCSFSSQLLIHIIYPGKQSEVSLLQL